MVFSMGVSLSCMSSSFRCGVLWAPLVPKHVRHTGARSCLGDLRRYDEFLFWAVSHHEQQQEKDACTAADDCEERENHLKLVLTEWPLSLVHAHFSAPSSASRTRSVRLSAVEMSALRLVSPSVEMSHRSMMMPARRSPAMMSSFFIVVPLSFLVTSF